MCKKTLLFGTFQAREKLSEFFSPMNRKGGAHTVADWVALPKEEAEGSRASTFGVFFAEGAIHFANHHIHTFFGSNSAVLSAVRPLIDIFAGSQNKIECQQSKKEIWTGNHSRPTFGLSSAENRPRLSFRLMTQYQGRMICIPSSPENPLVGSTEAMHLLLEHIPSLFLALCM